jgi:hypothetical protein
MEGDELTKVKNTHSRDPARNPLNMDSGIHNGRQDCEIGTVCGGALVGGERVNGGEKGEGIW